MCPPCLSFQQMPSHALQQITRSGQEVGLELASHAVQEVKSNIDVATKMHKCCFASRYFMCCKGWTLWHLYWVTGQQKCQVPLLLLQMQTWLAQSPQA